MADIRDIPEYGKWQPIETAPKDGTAILVAHSEAAFDVWWSDDENGWVDDCMDDWGDKYIIYHPTHWMPLPPLPGAKYC